MIYLGRSNVVERPFFFRFRLSQGAENHRRPKPGPGRPALVVQIFQAATYSSKTAPADLHPRIRRG